MSELRKIKESLYLFERHICCDDAEYYLFPPNKATDGFVQLEIGTIRINAVRFWYIDIGDGGNIIKVRFCPFCGENLES